MNFLRNVNINDYYNYDDEFDPTKDYEEIYEGLIIV